MRRGIVYATPDGAMAAECFMFPDAPPANYAWVRMLQTSPYDTVLSQIGCGRNMYGVSRAGDIVARHVNAVLERARRDGLVFAPHWRNEDPLEALMNNHYR
jgi:hypothetical protein